MNANQIVNLLLANLSTNGYHVLWSGIFGNVLKIMSISTSGQMMVKISIINGILNGTLYGIFDLGWTVTSANQSTDHTLEERIAFAYSVYPNPDQEFGVQPPQNIPEVNPEQDDDDDNFLMQNHGNENNLFADPQDLNQRNFRIPQKF